MKKIIAANWKMNKTREQTHEFFREISQKTLRTNKDVVIFAPFTALGIAREYADELGFTVGAQNFYPAQNGAFTGEISAEMLCEIGARVVLIGHSERRVILGETDAFINQKVLAAFANGLYVCLCIGEKLEHRDGGHTEKILGDQLRAALAGLDLKKNEMFYKLVVAYEPVWAIGTGKVATLRQIESTHTFIKKTLGEMYPEVVIPVIYGGSANEKNAAEILSTPGVDGVLVGGASLDPEKFTTIINS